MGDDIGRVLGVMLAGILYITLCAAGLFLLTVPAVLALGVAGLVVGGGTGIALLAGRLFTGPAELDVPADRSRPSDPDSPVGIEPAWRTYLARQAASDAVAAVAAVRAAVRRLFRSLNNAMVAGGGAAAIFWPLVPVPYAFVVAFAVGAGGAVVVCAVVVGVPAATWWLVRSMAVRGENRLVERRIERGHLAATCTRPGCDEVTDLPIVECGKCHRLHHALRPGDYGLLRRICTCGSVLPTSVDRVVPPLLLRCPRCGDELPADALSGADVRLVVFGAPGAGASRFASAGTAALAAAVEQVGGTAVARCADQTYPARLRDCRTLRVEVPLPIGRRVGSLHVYDSPGRVYRDPVLRSRLYHMRAAQGFVLVIDPTRLPRIATRAGAEDRIVSPEHCYWSVVSELRNQRVPLRERALAVAITHLDELEQLLPGRAMAPGAKRVRELANGMGLENLLLAADRDFGVVRHFAVAAPEPEWPSAADALRWLSDEAGLRLPRAERE